MILDLASKTYQTHATTPVSGTSQPRNQLHQRIGLDITSRSDKRGICLDRQCFTGALSLARTVVLRVVPGTRGRSDGSQAQSMETGLIVAASVLHFHPASVTTMDTLCSIRLCTTLNVQGARRSGRKRSARKERRSASRKKLGSKKLSIV